MPHVYMFLPVRASVIRQNALLSKPGVTKVPLFSSFAPATSANTHKNSKTALTEFSNCFSERPSPLGSGAAGRSSLLAEMTAMPQRYSHQRRRTSTAAAAARRMARRRREQGKNNNLSSDHNNHRSKKLAMLSRYEEAKALQQAKCAYMWLEEHLNAGPCTPQAAIDWFHIEFVVFTVVVINAALFHYQGYGLGYLLLEFQLDFFYIFLNTLLLKYCIGGKNTFVWMLNG